MSPSSVRADASRLSPRPSGTGVVVTAVLAGIVAERAGEPAVIDERGATTWLELDERVTRLVHALRDRGLVTGDTVLTMLGNQVEFIEVTLACAHGGWLLVPLNWHWVPREVGYVLADADARAVVVDARWASVVADAVSEPGVTPPGALLVAGDVDPPDGFEPYEEVLAAGRDDEIDDAQRGGPMFYTSGTTGWPKGVRSTLSTIGGPPEMLTLIAHSMGPLIGVTPGRRDVQLVCGPLYHSAQWVFGLVPCAVAPRWCCSTDSTPRPCSNWSTGTGSPTCTSCRRRWCACSTCPSPIRAAFDGSSLQRIVARSGPVLALGQATDDRLGRSDRGRVLRRDRGRASSP